MTRAPIEPESCAQCRFDATEYTRDDLLGTLRALAPMWRMTTESVDDAVLAIRPGPDVWSALEYASHSRDVTGVMGMLVDLALAENDPVLGDPPDIGDPVVAESFAKAISQLDKHVARLNGKALKLTPGQWARRFTVGARTADVAWTVGHAVHDGIHHLRDVGRGLHALGAGAPTQHGTVVQVNVSGGGVPKRAVPSLEFDRQGVVGDTQADRKHHGKPMQALSLWSAEVIEALVAEGHSVTAGAAGENVTVSGIDWTSVRPGVRIALGPALVEVSAFATPCAKNAQWFADRDFRRIDHNRHPGWSRAYAWILDGGRIETGAPVVVEP